MQGAVMNTAVIKEGVALEAGEEAEVAQESSDGTPITWQKATVFFVSSFIGGGSVLLAVMTAILAMHNANPHPGAVREDTFTEFKRTQAVKHGSLESDMYEVRSDLRAIREVLTEIKVEIGKRGSQG